MKKTTIVFILLIAVMNTYSQNFKEYYFRFDINDKTELNELTKIISIDKVVDHTVFAYSTSLDFDKFKELGYNYTFIENAKSSKAVVATNIEEMANWNKYPTYDVYVEMMNSYATSYPNICKLINVGTTANGRSLLTLKISDNVNVEENEPEFFYTSTMHGDETTGFALMLRLIDSLATNYGSVPEITNLIDSIEIYINPNSNPDGTYGSDNNTISYPTRTNGNGVDINRNFPDPSEGDHPDGKAWQPETKAMMAFANEHRFTMSANFHGGIEVANYPWDNTYRRHPDDDWFLRVSRDYATSCQNNSPAGYFDDENNGITNGADWYVVYGGRQDYFTYYHNSREITFEISNTKTVSGSDLPDFWNYNKKALFQFMRECLYGISGTVKDANGNPLDAMIRIQNHDTDLDSSMVFTDPDVGDYHRPIEPGTYDIIASSTGYINDTIKNISVIYNNLQIADYILEFDSIQFEIIHEIINDTLDIGDSTEHSFIIKNIGKKDLEYSLFLDFPTKSSSWIELSKKSGLVIPENNDTIIIFLNATELSQGHYHSMLELSVQNKVNYYYPIDLYIRTPQFIDDINTTQNIKIYPNPFDQYLEIEFIPLFNNVTITLYNYQGLKLGENTFKVKKEIKNHISINHKNFNIQNLTNGIYFLKISAGNKEITKRILKILR